MQNENSKTEYSSVRQANFELLRLLAMFMVIVLHYVSRTGSLATQERELNSVRIAGGVLECLCIAAVNVYVLISGYFLCKSSFRMKRFLGLMAQILIYSLLIPVVIGGIFRLPLHGQDIWTMSQYFFPIMTEHYWFATSYIFLYLLSPLLATAVQHMDRQQHKITLGLFLFFLCILKSISPVQLVMDRAGYDVLWFICLYLMAAYIRLYGTVPFLGERMLSRRQGAAMFFLSSALIFVLYVALHLIYEKTGQLAYYTGVPFHYNSVLCLTASLGLFTLFLQVRIPEGKAARLTRRLAPYTFGVYLLHEHIDIRYRWTGWMNTITDPIFGSLREGSPLRFVLQALLGCLILYAVCLLIDMVRAKIQGTVLRIFLKD